MMDAIILLIIFGFVAFVVYTTQKEKTKRHRIKVEAALREEEMMRGYAPGTYSDLSNLNEELNETSSGSKKADLERGIKDLEARLKNLDSIMKEKKN